MTLIAIMGIADPEVAEARSTIENLQAGEIRTHLITKDSLAAAKIFAKKTSFIQDAANPYGHANRLTAVIKDLSRTSEMVVGDEETVYNTTCMTAYDFR
jgi:cation transport ATPase